MDQRCPQANRSVHITEAKIEVPAVLKPSHSLRFGMPRLLVTSTERRRNTVVAHLKSEVNAKASTYATRPCHTTNAVRKSMAWPW